jgi:hypothetical protein
MEGGGIMERQAVAAAAAVRLTTAQRARESGAVVIPQDLYLSTATKERERENASQLAKR